MKKAAWIGGSIGGVLLIVLIVAVSVLSVGTQQFQTYARGEFSKINTNMGTVTNSAMDLAKITGSLQTDVATLKGQRDKDLATIKQDTEQQITVNDLKKQVEAVKQQAAVDKQFVEQGARITAVEKTQQSYVVPPPVTVIPPPPYYGGAKSFYTTQAGRYQFNVTPCYVQIYIDGQMVTGSQVVYLGMGWHSVSSSSDFGFQLWWIGY